MCGIFGFVATDNSKYDLELLEHIAIDTERRGPHAFGFAWIDARNRLRMYKQPGRISENLSLLRMARDARMLIGHCRYATHGDPSNNLNNHPHASDGGWIVHNGVIGHHCEINEGHLLNPVTDCDSETLAMLIEEVDGSLTDRVAYAINECATSPFAMMGLWRSPMRLVAGRMGNPLHWIRYDEGYYLASNASATPDRWVVDDGTMLEFTHRGGETIVEQSVISDVVASIV
jgi:glucosamine 6-phosphate synthetase-like amidotransferase/phosphosugar isomerase protein